MSIGRTVILGLGNPILCDDAVGLRVIEALDRLLAIDPIRDVMTLQSTRAGFELIDLLTGFDRAIIVDAYQSDNPEPGRIRHLELDSIAGIARLNAVHEINIKTAFELGKQMGIPMPSSVDIYAVEVEDVCTLSEEMTEMVSEIVEPLARELYSKVREMHSGSPAEKTTIIRDEGRVFYPPAI